MKARLLALAALVLSASAHAQVTVSDAWVRATVPVQQTSGAFMTLRSAQATRLVAVTSPVAAHVEMHQSDMKDGVMSMNQVDSVALPAGRPVALASGGLHLMLVGLKRQLKEGEKVPLTLVFSRGRKKQEQEQVTVQAEVKPLSYMPPRR